MKRCWLGLSLLVLLVSLGGCAGLGTSQPVKLTSLDYSYIFSFTTTYRHVTINAVGDLHVVQNLTTSAADVRTADMRLTPAQMQDLATVFEGWDQLKTEYPVFINSPVITITYNNYQVQAGGGDSTPKSFMVVMGTLDKLANDALAKAGSQPASQPGGGGSSP